MDLEPEATRPPEQTDPPADDLPTNVGLGRALLGMVMIVGGFAIALASLVLRDGNLTGRMPTIPYAGLIAKIFGAVLFGAGVWVAGRRGSIVLGTSLLIGGAGAYLANLLINHEYGGPVNGIGLLAVLLGIVLIAFVNGWIGQES